MVRLMKTLKIYIFVVALYVNGTNSNYGTDFGGLNARSVNTTKQILFNVYYSKTDESRVSIMKNYFHSKSDFIPCCRGIPCFFSA
jgi:hypothetical protein